MTTEKKVPDTEVEEKKEVEQPQYSEIETRAMEMGWRPKEEFEGDEADFIDAKEFVGRKPLFDKIESTSKELKAVRRALEQFKQHYGKVEVAAYNKALNDLKQKKREARREGDFDTEDVLDEQIEQVQKQAAEAERAHSAPVVVEETPAVPEFVAWKERNKWYETKAYMKVYADGIGVELHKQGLSPEEVLRKVEQDVRKKFPDEFTNPRKASAPDVEESRGAQRKSTSFEDSLDATERQIMNTLIRGGHITKEKYLDDLKKIKGQK